MIWTAQQIPHGHAMPGFEKLPSVSKDVKVSWTNGSARNAVISTTRSMAIIRPE
jgi:hypothetical protein